MRVERLRICFTRSFLTKISGLINHTCKMADLQEPFELCKVLHNGSLMGIARHVEADNVVLTFRDRGVLVYNVSNNYGFIRAKRKNCRHLSINLNPTLKFLFSLKP